MPPLASTAPASVPPPGAPVPRVLVVDDEASVRLGCVMTLRSDGWEAVGEGSAAAALARLSAAEDRFDVLVLDYAMPELDGLALAAALDPAKRPPILLASAHADGAVALAALRLGIWDFQAKPFMPDDLRRRVRRLYARHAAPTEGAPINRMAGVLLCCHRCAWDEALQQLRAWPEADRTDPETRELVKGLVLQVAGNETEAAVAFKSARWWPEWHRQGVEMWSELSRRLG